jgi:cyclase
VKIGQWQRWFLLVSATLLTIFGILGWHHSLKAQSPTNLTLEAAGLKLEEVGPGIYSLIASTDYPPQDPNAAICNGGIVIGPDGVLVIDPFQNKALANLMFSTVKQLTDRPIRYVLNTHYHFDHTGGNPAASAKGIPIIGRGPIREFMLEKNTSFDPNPTPPSLIVQSDSTIWLGDRQIEIEKVEGHSGGTDIVAYVPDAQVLFAGDILFYQRFPYTADGNIRQWQTSLSRLIERYPKAQVVPGHGPVTDRQGLTTFKQYLDSLEKLALTWKAQSLSKEQAIASAAKIPDAYQGYKFQALYPGNLETAYQQITLEKSGSL